MTENIESTVIRMRNVVNNVTSFLWFTTNSSGVIFEKINTAAITFLKFVTMDDFTRMQQIAESYVNDYNTNYASLIGGIRQLLNWLSHNRTSPGKVHANAYQDIHRNQILTNLEHILAIGTDNGKLSINYRLIRLVRHPDQWEHCRNKFIYLAAALVSPSENETEVDSSDLWNNISQHRLSSMPDIKDISSCLHGLDADLAGVVNTLETMVRTIRSTLKFHSLFSYNAVLFDARNDISNLRQKMSWFSEQMHSYARNKTTMLDISRDVTITMIAEVEGTINTILTYLERKVFDRLHILKYIIGIEIRKLYVKGMAAMIQLAAYYNNNYIEDELRLMKIWRQPKFQFIIPEVVGFKYPASQAWNSWSTTTTLRQFVLGGASDQIISNIIKRYTNGMRREVFYQQREFSRIKNDILSSLFQLADDLEKIKRTSAMDEVFVA